MLTFFRVDGNVEEFDCDSTTLFSVSSALSEQENSKMTCGFKDYVLLFNEFHYSMFLERKKRIDPLVEIIKNIDDKRDACQKEKELYDPGFKGFYK